MVELLRGVAAKLRVQIMDQELATLLERARQVTPTEAELKEHRINLAVANGVYSDARITVDAMKATRTIVEASEKSKKV